MYTRNWESLQRPDGLLTEEDTHTNAYAKFIIEPLEKGFGITIGNALRRVLLSSMQGCAAVAVQIDGIAHEFETISGVEEDIMQIIFNIKKLHIKQLEPGLQELELIGAGPAQLRAGDIVSGGKVEVLNKDLRIASLDKDATLSMRIYVDQNKGYVTAEENDQTYPILPSNAIPLDSVHTPIERIHYEVSNARVGQTTDYDKLLFEIWTNGAMTPEDALAYAAKIVKEYMAIFINFDEKEAEVLAKPAEEDQPSYFDHLNKLVKEMDLSVRSINCLQNANIDTIGQLVQRTEQQMLKTKNFGRKSLSEVKQMLGGMGLSLGMNLPDYEPPEPLSSSATQ